MKNILLPTRPQYCEKILSGEKTLELRITAPKEVPFKVYLHCTKNGGNLILDNDDKRYYFKPKCYNANDTYLNGKVIAEYIVDKIDDLIQFGMGIAYTNNNEFLDPDEVIKKSCLSENEIINYFGNKDGYAYHISDLKIYDKPKNLSEFVNVKGETITRAPQSWQYCQEKDMVIAADTKIDFAILKTTKSLKN